jgi:hypothetical protein
MTHPATLDGVSALKLSADLSSCRIEESAWTLHHGLREHCPHEAIAIAATGYEAPLSQWASPTLELPAALDWSSPTLPRDIGRPVVMADGDAG